MKAIDVRDLLERPGASRTLRIGEPVAGLQLELAEVPEETPIRGELQLESVVEGIFVSGALRWRMRLSCARCLVEFERDACADVAELFAAQPDEEVDYAVGPEGFLDPEAFVRDAVVLAMPFAPMCRPDCRGLCDRCGGDRNLGECRCPEQPVDPRWAHLEQLFQ